ncbi:MFS transporter [Rhodococcus sp. B50]|uniref:MFS transporter n=1 Tax=Rhodococcus sp. B50 TaxID=2682847 RepID=UPI001BD2B30F|nr:MFS transporter [Rhodococcus sp. B50]MBS9372438.1 Multidrug resistance protein 3 [Rhodococcus sp. B50]
MSSHNAANPQPSSPTSVVPPPTHHDILAVLLPLLAALFAALLSGTVAIPALPAVTAELGGGSVGLTWIITVALLANASSTPVWGSISDRYDTKILVQIALLTLTVGSVISACAPTLPVLLAGRVVQGVGLGGVVAVTVAVLGALIPPREQGRYSGYGAVVMAVSMAGGPLLGGALVDTPLSWRACFLLPAAPAVLALVALRRRLTPRPRRSSDTRTDWLGAVLLTAGVTLVLVWVTGSGEFDDGLLSWPQIGYPAVGAGLLVGAIAVERRAPTPVVPIDLFGQRTVACTLVASMSSGFAFYAALSFLSEFFQAARHHSATATGILLTPLVFGLALSSFASGRLITRFGKWKALLVAGALLQLAGCTMLVFTDRSAPIWWIELAVLLLGLGIGVLLQNLVSLVQNAVAPERFGAAGAAVFFFRLIGAAVGLPLLAATVPPHGEGIGRVFLLLSVLSVVGLVTVALLPNQRLRTSFDAVEEPSR